MCKNQQLGILSDAPEMQGQLVSAHGMLAILEVLEGRGSREVIMRLLQIINLVNCVSGCCTCVVRDNVLMN